MKYYTPIVNMPLTVTLKAYRNNETYMQDLPSMTFKKGDIFYLNNENAPTIEGFDFVCCTNNNTIISDNIEIKVYYIPQTILDRNKIYWNSAYINNTSIEGNFNKQDFVNTFNGVGFNAMFYGTNITHSPKLNLSNSNDVTNMFFLCKNLIDVSESYFDLSNVSVFTSLFYGCSKLTSVGDLFISKTKPIKIDNLFTNCNSLTDINFSGMDTSNTLSMNNLFANCTSLTTIKGYIDLSLSPKITSMFANTPNLKNVKLKNVPHSLDLSVSGGTEGKTYIIENYID